MSSKYIQPELRNQITFFSDLDSMVSEDNTARIIDEIINNMNLAPSDFANYTESNFGRTKHNPLLMSKLYIYSYINKIRSSRKIEIECTRNIELMWLMGKIVPDHKCISDFRKNNKKALKKIFSEFLLICEMSGLIGKSMVAIDGTKMKANNSRSKCYSRKKIAKMLNYFENKVAEYEMLLDKNDSEESKIESVEIIESPMNEIKEKLEATKEKIEQFKDLDKKMQDNKISQFAVTDTDSRMMKSSNKGFDVSYNSQIAVDDKNHFIVTEDVTTDTSDINQLNDMTTKVLESLSVKEGENVKILVDKGYFSKDEIEKCTTDKRVDLVIAVPDSKSPANDDKYNLNKFKYNQNEDNYICPQGVILSNSSSESAKSQVYKNSKACTDCNHKSKCTKGKIREIRVDDSIIFKREAKKKFYKEYENYQKRQQIVEHPFGTIKRALGFDHFLLRRLEKVKIENTLHTIAYNFKRLLNIIKTQGVSLQFANKKVSFSKS